MFKSDKSLAYGLGVLATGVLFWLIGSEGFAFLLFVGVAIYFISSGVVALFSNETFYPSERTMGQEGIPLTSSAPAPNEPTIADKVKSIHLVNGFKCPSCGATNEPTDMKCTHCGSILVNVERLPKPSVWGDVGLGQTIAVKHPQGDRMKLRVVYRVIYGELWQARMRRDVPWTLTGNYFIGLGLETEKYLVNWQSRYYLLESRRSLTELDINSDFAGHARIFGASNQTASVRFDYEEETWHMDDIGRFRIEYHEGIGASKEPGAVGRFIHASHNNKALVVEDFQSGGYGMDTLWRGYLVTNKDIEV